METHSKYFFSNFKVPSLVSDIKPIIIADSFSTPSNIGSIIRLGANIGVSKIIVLNSSQLRDSKIKKTAGAAIQHVEIVFADTKELPELIPDGCVLTGIETVEGATSIFDPLPQQIAFVMGNEKFGLSDDLLKMCNDFRFIPMPGAIKSMNVSHAASVCLFEWYRQQIN